MSKAKKVISFSMMIAGAVFLFNPTSSLYDFMPDAIGYLLLAASITGLVDMLPYFDEARQGFIRLMWINLSKFPALLLVMSVSQSNPRERTIFLVFTFAYAIIELIYIFPTFKNFFNGILYLGSRYQCESVLFLPQSKRSIERMKCPSERGRLRKNKKPRTDKGPRRAEFLLTVTLVFMSVKAVLSFIPDICFLYTYDKNGLVTPHSQAIYNARPSIMLICFAVVIAFGIVWLVMFTKYIRRISSDASLSELINTKYENEIAPLTGKRIFRTIRSGMTLVVIAVACSTDVVIDQVNLLPDALCGILILASALVLRRLSKNVRPLFCVAAVYTVVSVITSVLSYRFNTLYGYLYLGSEPADTLYHLFVASSAFEAALLICTVILLCRVIRDMIRSYTGHIEDGITSVSDVNRMKKSLNSYTTVFAVFGVINAVASVIYNYILSFTTIVEADPDIVDGGMLVIPKYAYSWQIMLAFSVIWFVSAICCSNALKNQAEEKYIFFGEKA